MYTCTVGRFTHSSRVYNITNATKLCQLSYVNLLEATKTKKFFKKNAKHFKLFLHIFFFVVDNKLNNTGNNKICCFETSIGIRKTLSLSCKFLKRQKMFLSINMNSLFLYRSQVMAFVVEILVVVLFFLNNQVMC